MKTVVVLPCDLRLQCALGGTEMKLNNEIDLVELGTLERMLLTLSRVPGPF